MEQNAQADSLQARGSHPNLERFQEVMDEVYGPFDETKAWTPKPYKEGKGRYLWTDAYGVCNFVTLFNLTGQARYLDQADALITEVHNVLGKDRKGRNRLDNATDEDPLKGGLRIGKEDPEGTPDGDGQYFHYLTKWALALNRMSIARDSQRYNDLAIQLIKAIHPRFVRETGEGRPPRMYWKMSIDLSHPHVDSEGNLDPYDGFITYRLLRDRAAQQGDTAAAQLDHEISDMARMVKAKYPRYRSNDPLDLGEALWICHWYPDEEWAATITKRSLESLEGLWKTGSFSGSTRYRLAFREFGTTIGVQVNRRAGEQWKERVKELHEYWDSKLFTRDHDITPVMYCTSLIPGCLAVSH